MYRIQICALASSGPALWGDEKDKHSIASGSDNRSSNGPARLAPDSRTIDKFKRSDREGIRGVCRRSMTPCRDLTPSTQEIVSVDSSSFKAANPRASAHRA